MRIIKNSAVAIAMATLVTACGGGQPVQQSATTPTQVAPSPTVALDCEWPDAPGNAAPGWICDEPVEGLEISATGTARQSAAGINFMKNQAAAAARVQIAQMLSTHVQNLTRNYMEVTGATADTETVDAVATSVSNLVTDQMVSGASIYRTRTSPNGMMYVLVGMDPATVEAASRTVLQSSMNNDEALWQQFRAEQGYEQLAAEIARMGDR